MKKVVNITIGGIVFAIEEDAYTALAQYLDTIREYYRKEDEQGEIVADIELSIAEKLGDYTKKHKDVVSMNNIDAVIKEMGTVADFEEVTDGDGNEQTASTNTTGDKKPKKLYRNVDDQIIAGVASGLAAYFGIDAVFVRLLFVLSIFFSGIGILVYLVLWLVMPAAETVSQKFEMQGDPVTLQQFEKILKDKMPKGEKERSAFNRALHLPFVILKGVLNFIKTIFKNLGPLARVVVGLALLLVSGGIALALTIFVTGMHFSVNSGLFMLPVREFLTGAQYLLGLSAVYLLFLVPGTIGVLAGWSIVKKANKFTGALVGVLAVLWIGALFSAGHVASSVVPQYQEYFASMPDVELVHELDDFEYIEVYSGDTVAIKYGEEYSITLAGKETSVQRRIFEVHGGVLEVNNERGVCIGCFDTSVDIVITTPTLSGIEASHATHISMDEFETDTFSAIFKHSSRGTLQVIARRAEITSSHSSEVVMEGEVDELEAFVRHSSELDTSDLVNKKTLIEAKYSSVADVGEVEVLNATARHSSTIRYDGDPELTEDSQHSSEIRKKF